ncbi:hypothetical protein [Zhongshania sp. BJYM1]|uniref:hypothetical protein n=1 Tax=Zhongshania aquatica TaxID=2965069 RepID=UPI0022B392DA|nr:hypothetical protein [Marortus sp. BJYM1]
MQLSKGTHAVPTNAVFIDCAADGLPKVPEVKVFDGNKITLQTVRMCQQVSGVNYLGRQPR